MGNNDLWKTASGKYFAHCDGFDGGWSVCDANYNMMCVWVGDLNPAFITFDEVINHFNYDTLKYESLKVVNVDGITIEIPPIILNDIAEAEYHWEIA